MERLLENRRSGQRFQHIAVQTLLSAASTLLSTLFALPRATVSGTRDVPAPGPSPAHADAWRTPRRLSLSFKSLRYPKRQPTLLSTPFAPPRPQSGVAANRKR